MSLETATYIHQLNQANPAGSDRLQQGDDHIRLIKAALKSTFPNLTGPVNVDQDFLNTGIAGRLVPFGAITAFYGSVAPAGWAICNGQTVPRSDGSGTVEVPDLRGFGIAGLVAGQEVGLKFGQTSKTVTSAGGGAHNHTASTATAGAHTHGGSTQGVGLTEAQLPAHSHLLAKNGIANDILTASTPISQERTAGGDTEYILNGKSGGVADVGRSSTVGSGEAHSHPISSDGGHTHTMTVDAVPAHSHSVTVDVTQPTMALHYIMKI